MSTRDTAWGCDPRLRPQSIPGLVVVLRIQVACPRSRPLHLKTRLGIAKYCMFVRATACGGKLPTPYKPHTTRSLISAYAPKFELDLGQAT